MLSRGSSTTAVVEVAWLRELAEGPTGDTLAAVDLPVRAVLLADGIWTGRSLAVRAVGALRVATLSLGSQVAAAEARVRGAEVARWIRSIGADVTFLLERGIPPAFVKILRDLHTDNKCFIKAESGISSPVSSNAGVRQGSKEGPLLFNLFYGPRTI